MNDAMQKHGPAKPEQLTVEFTPHSGGFVFTKKRGGGPGCFLLLWLTGWTVGCVGLIGAVFNDVSMLLFAVPFWVSWIAVASFLVWIYFGREILVVKHDKALFLRRAIITLTTRSVPRDDVLGFSECRSKHQENDQYLYGIEMKTMGKPVRFAFRLSPREREWLILQMNQSLGPDAPTDSPDLEEPDTQPTDDAPRLAGGLTRQTTRDEPPSDCSWVRTDNPDPEFEQRGSMPWPLLFGLLFVNLFWNGIVSVFVMGLFGGMKGEEVLEGLEWWGMFVFLIPFEVIGLSMFGRLIFVLAEPFRRTCWRFERYQITRHIQWPLIKRSKTWIVEQLDRIELRSGDAEEENQTITSTLSSNSTNESGLAFVSDDNADLCTFDDLTQGEALWIADVLLDERDDWFR